MYYNYQRKILHIRKLENKIQNKKEIQGQLKECSLHNQYATGFTQDAHSLWSKDSLNVKVQLIYEKLEIFIYENTFMNEATETLK